MSVALDGYKSSALNETLTIVPQLYSTETSVVYR